MHIVYHIMQANLHDKSCYSGLCGVYQDDKQIYTELIQSYEMKQHSDQVGSSAQQKTPSSNNRKMQPASKMAICQSVVLLLVLFLQGAILSMTAVILIKMMTSTTAISENNVNLISENNTQKLINIFSTLNNLKGTSASTAGVVDDILLVVEELLEIQNASVLFNSIRPVSCKDIKTVLPNSPTGYYHVNSRNIYCNMGELCGTGGGWTRLAYLDSQTLQ